MARASLLAAARDRLSESLGVLTFAYPPVGLKLGELALKASAIRFMLSGALLECSPDRRKIGLQLLNSSPTVT